MLAGELSFLVRFVVSEEGAPKAHKNTLPYLVLQSFAVGNVKK